MAERNEKGQFVKGSGGRKKGSQNKTTKAVKNALRDALEGAHEDGAEGYFKQLAKDDPALFVSLVRKLIPNQIEGKVDGVPTLVLDQNFVTGNVAEVDTEEGES
ncbi:MAG: hypothetical protein NXI30_04450 [bacterium]|nr:hypothetical protein [bacterium]